MRKFKFAEELQAEQNRFRLLCWIGVLSILFCFSIYIFSDLRAILLLPDTQSFLSQLSIMPLAILVYMYVISQTKPYYNNFVLLSLVSFIASAPFIINDSALSTSAYVSGNLAMMLLCVLLILPLRTEHYVYMLILAVYIVVLCPPCLFPLMVGVYLFITCRFKIKKPIRRVLSRFLLIPLAIGGINTLFAINIWAILPAMACICIVFYRYYKLLA